MQFVVTAWDFSDPEALSRRLANREEHLAGVRRMLSEGTFLSGGAILDSENRMIGSSVHVQFENRAALDQWLENDPYTKAKVWDSIEVREIKLFPVPQFKSV